MCRDEVFRGTFIVRIMFGYATVYSISALKNPYDVFLRRDIFVKPETLMKEPD